jgi:hypothetical protein
LLTETRRLKKRKNENEKKKKVDLLAAALSGRGGHNSTWGRSQRRGKGRPPRNSPQAQPKGSEPLKKNQCAYCPHEGHGKMSAHRSSLGTGKQKRKRNL